MKFTADTSMTIAGYHQIEHQVDLEITAIFTGEQIATRWEPGHGPTIEVLSAYVWDAKNKTRHPLPDFLVDLLTNDKATTDWLLEEGAERSRQYVEERGEWQRDTRLQAVG